MVACASGYLDRVKEMLAEGTDPNFVNDQGDTPLSWAVAWERYKIAECLLSHGAEVELPERPKWSPLMHAASRGNEAMVSLLMAYGADALRRNKYGQLSVDLARMNGRLDCVFLIERLIRTAREPSRCAGYRKY
jgi:ankyrin repeat protein